MIRTCEISAEMENLKLINLAIYFVLCLLFLNSVLSHENKENFIKGQSHIYKDIKNKVEAIKEQCGALCKVDVSTYQQISEDSKFYYVPIEKEIDCNGLWNSPIFDESSKFKSPPQKLPKYLIQYFKYHSDMVNIKLDYYDYDNIYKYVKDNIRNQTFDEWGKL